MNLHKRLTDSLFDYLQPICADAGVPELTFDYDNGVEAAAGYVALDIRSYLGRQARSNIPT